jgi:lipoic acid synthetase
VTRPSAPSRVRVRWLGQVPYREADDLQRALLARAVDDYLLLLEHPHVYTLGTNAHALEHVLVPPATVGAELVRVDRGGDVTYHGPGQLVGYPIVTLPAWRDGRSDVVAYVRRLEDVLIDVLGDLGVDAHRAGRYTGVWVGEEKIAAIGVKVARGRTRHGFALNVDPDLSMFDHIVPCGIPDKGVTSLAQTTSTTPDMKRVVDAVTARFTEHFPYSDIDRQDIVWRERSADLSAFTREANGGGAGPGRARGRGTAAGPSAAAGSEREAKPKRTVSESAADASGGGLRWRDSLNRGSW